MRRNCISVTHDATHADPGPSAPQIPTFVFSHYHAPVPGSDEIPMRPVDTRFATYAGLILLALALGLLLLGLASPALPP